MVDKMSESNMDYTCPVCMGKIERIGDMNIIMVKLGCIVNNPMYPDGFMPYKYNRPVFYHKDCFPLIWKQRIVYN